MVEIDRQIANCTRCRLGRPVLGEGPQPADVMLIGQNPGAEEQKLGRPFVGRSGKYLNQVLHKSGIRREDLFITNVVKCLTASNRKPTELEIASCLPLLAKQIRQIQPRIIVLMGEVAWKTPRLKGIRYLVTYHPAAAMRFPKIKAKFEADFQKLKEMILSVR